MSHWLNGNGALTIAGSEFGRGEYKIHVQHNRADGRLWADAETLEKAYTSSDVILTLADGKQIAIDVTSWVPGQDAIFAVNTPL